MASSPPQIDFRRFYDRFNASVTDIDCGTKCAPNNPSGKPFCCDIFHAVPAAYHQEWRYLQRNTHLWHPFRGDECASDRTEMTALQSETPANMRLLACQGPERCQRPFRALSCRQFPFFPFITSDYRFIGLAYEWEFQSVCWVINNLNRVTESYHQAFVQAFDELFNQWPAEMDSYAIHSEDMRAHFSAKKRRIPILHRCGGLYRLSPVTERLRKS